MLRNRQGFTLFEVLITITIMAIVLSVVGTGVVSFKSRQSFTLDVESVVEGLRNAQNRAIFSDGGTGWGIQFSHQVSGRDYFEIFSGAAYATSSVVTKQEVSASVFTDPAEGQSATITFAQETGVPSEPMIIALQRTNTNDMAIVTMSSLGKITVERESSLAGYWPFDERSGTVAYDASSAGNNGDLTASASAPSWQTSGCKVGTCLTFNGSSTYTQITGYKGISQASARTITMWIKGSTGSTAQSLIGWGSDSTGAEYVIDVDETIDAAEVEVSGGYRTATTDIIDGTWHFVAVVFSGTDVSDHTIYVDGAAESITTTSAQALSTGSTEDVLIGSDPILAQYFNGTIDDVRIYSRALSAMEIEELYESY